MRLNQLTIFLTHSSSRRRFTYGKQTVNALSQAPGFGDFTSLCTKGAKKAIIFAIYARVTCLPSICPLSDLSDGHV
jgi:hypothetical protein